MPAAQFTCTPLATVVPADNAREGTPVAIINETLARRFWPNDSPLGHEIQLRTGRSAQTSLTVVGVSADVRQQGMTTPSPPEIALPYFRSPRRQVYLVVRGGGSPEAIVPSIKRAIWSLDPAIPLTNIRTMEAAFDEDVFAQRLMAPLLTCFSALAALLAALGIYAVIAHATEQRAYEIAVRMLFGATPRSIVRLIFRQGAPVVVLSLAIGVTMAIALGRTLQGLAYGITTHDPLTLATVAVLLLGFALIAMYVPARRATRADPSVALRAE